MFCQSKKLIQDYEVQIASLQEQVERNSMLSSMISSSVRFDVEEDENEGRVFFVSENI